MRINMSTVKKLKFRSERGGYTKTYGIDPESIPSILNADTVCECEPYLLPDTIRDTCLITHDPLTLLTESDNNFEEGVVGVLYSSNNTFEQNILCCAVYWSMQPFISGTKSDWLSAHWHHFRQFHEYSQEEIEDKIRNAATSDMRHNLSKTLARARKELFIHHDYIAV